MREIKFRTFYNNKMYDNYEALRILTNRSADCDWTPSAIVMQFTGLKDKNGVDIYEGDIVKCDHIQGYSWEKSYTDIGVIEFSKGGFALKCKAKGKENAKDISKRYFFLNFKDDRIFESIGNIYENPELLP